MEQNCMASLWSARHQTRQLTRISSRKEFTDAGKNHSMVEVKETKKIQKQSPQSYAQAHPDGWNKPPAGSKTSWLLFSLVICPHFPTHSAFLESRKQRSVLFGRYWIGHWLKLNIKDVSKIPLLFIGASVDSSPGVSFEIWYPVVNFWEESVVRSKESKSDSSGVPAASTVYIQDPVYHIC